VVHEPVVTVVQARSRVGGACRLGTPESERKARAVLTAARLDRAVCEALNAGNLPDDERERLGLLLLKGGAK
jgi:hypothetical protein